MLHLGEELMPKELIDVAASLRMQAGGGHALLFENWTGVCDV
jgi:hypothetical protein